MDIDPRKKNIDGMLEIKSSTGTINDFGGMKVSLNQNQPNIKPNYSNTASDFADAGLNAAAMESLPDGKKLFDLTLDMFKERLGKFLALIVIAALASAAIELAFSIPLGFMRDQKSILNYNIVHIAAAFALLSVIISLPSIILGISIIETIKDGNLGVREALNKSLAKLKNYILTQAIGVLMYSGIFLLIPSIAAIQVISSIQSSTFDLKNMGIEYWLFGIIMTIPLLYIVEVWVFMSLLGVILENLRPFESFSYSYELIKGKIRSIFWRMIGLSWRLVIYVIILQVIFGIAIGFPMGIIIAIAGKNSAVSGVVLYIYDYLNIAIQLLVTSFVLVYQYNIYESLKIIKKDMPQNYATRHISVIKALTALGGLLIALLIFVIFYYAPSIDAFVKKAIPAEKLNQFGDLGIATTMPAKSSENESETGKTDVNNKNIPKKENGLSEKEKIFERDAQRKKDLASLSGILRKYGELNGIYPISSSLVKLNEENDIVSAIKSFDENAESFPVDPKNPEYYYGYLSADGKSFELSARLENPDDVDCDPGIKSICIYKVRF